MKRFLTGTAIASVMALPALADNHMGDMQKQMDAMGVKASNLIDRSIYMPSGNMESNSLEAELSGEFTEVPNNWDMVGEIDDAVLTREGQVQSLLVDAGGFLGMSESEKQVDLSNVRFVQDADDEGEYFVVFTGDANKFREQQNYNEAQANADGMRRATQDEQVAQEMEQDGRQQEQQVNFEGMTTEDLLGIAVYGENDEWIGDLSELSLGQDANINGAIIDVGGFLGIGEKAVMMSMDKIDLRRTGGGEVRAYVSATEEELEGMESWTDS